MSTVERAEAIRRHYATDRNLRIHEETQAKYSVPPIDYVRWTLSTVEWAGDDTILDIGSGRGSHYSRLIEAQPNIRYYALDLSAQLLRNHPAAADCLALGDAMQLPYNDDSFDVVMANNMLYHLPDVDAALLEIKRVLKPAGKLLAATDSLQTLPELQLLIRRAISLLSANQTLANASILPCDSFALENGTRILARHFYAVVRHDLPCQLVFEELEPAMEYLNCMGDLSQGSLPGDVRWDDLLLIMRQQMAQLIQLMGKLEINLAPGVLIASDSGDFIHEFVNRHQANSRD